MRIKIGIARVVIGSFARLAMCGDSGSIWDYIDRRRFFLQLMRV